MSEILVEISRGRLIENIIRGHIAVVDNAGAVLAYAGDPRYISYLRSAAKPLQASAVLETGAIDAFGLNDRELAVMCGSHTGADEHAAAVQSILDKLGLDESAFTLGPDLSLCRALREQRLAAGMAPRKIYNNCSGKHSAMLALCRHMAWDIRDYHLPSHPVQQLILGVVAAYAGLRREEIIIGVDGCGVPVFAMPLEHMALAYCRLATSCLLPPERARAAERITKALAAHPRMIAGEGRFCSELIAVTQGRVIGKLGADGVYCAAPLNGNLGLALKIEDGNGSVLPVVMMRLLTELDLLTQAEREALSRFSRYDNINCKREKVGETRAVFSLSR